jgi:RNA polymerase sigma factor (sigma-70 family)
MITCVRVAHIGSQTREDSWFLPAPRKAFHRMANTPKGKAHGIDVWTDNHRRDLIAIAYRSLGSHSEADDVVQDAWLRWHGGDRSIVRNPRAFLTMTVTRLALDLRRSQSRHEIYLEPLVLQNLESSAEDPASVVERNAAVASALLVVLQTMSPPEGAAFVLREIFGLPYQEVAKQLHRSEVAVRQLAHRARKKASAGKVRYPAPPPIHANVVRAFNSACRSGGVTELINALSEKPSLEKPQTQSRFDRPSHYLSGAASASSWRPLTEREAS